MSLQLVQPVMRRLAVLVPLAIVACGPAGEERVPRGVAGPGSAPTSTTSAAGTPPTQVPAEVASAWVLQEVARGLEAPVDVDVAPGDTSGRLYVLEKAGRIRIVEEGKVLARPMLDFTDRVSTSNEQGLLGLAFHPDFPRDGRLFVNYTDREGHTHVTELRVDPADLTLVDPASARDLVVIQQPYANHNGGHLQFGPDGKLWIGLGDGGAGGDPHGAGQRDDTLLGKLFRVDVNAAKPEAEIMAKGLRNPWRFTFDPATGDLFVADVGQNLWEEVSVVSGAQVQAGDLNFGWKMLEGTHCFEAETCDTAGLVAPVVEYGHADGTGCSITGGEVLRLAAAPPLDGAYFYSDFCSGLLRSFRWRDGRVADHWDWKAALDPKAEVTMVASFGRDAGGELLLVSLDGVIRRLAQR